MRLVGQTWLLLLAVVVGFALRVYRLDGQDLWGDEGFTTYVISLPWRQVLSPGVDTHPPVYYALLKAWATMVQPPPSLGQSAFALRFLSVVLSLPMIPLAYLAAIWIFSRAGPSPTQGGASQEAYKIGKSAPLTPCPPLPPVERGGIWPPFPTGGGRGWGMGVLASTFYKFRMRLASYSPFPPREGGRGVGLLAAWLMAIAPVHVYYAQELRMYAAVAMLALASTVLLVALLQGRGGGWWVGYALVTLVGMYTHYGFFFILPAHVLAVFVKQTMDGRRWAIDQSQADRPSSIVHRPSSIIHRLSSAIRRPSSIVYRLSSIVLLLALAYLPWVIGQTRYLLGHSRQSAWTWRLDDLGVIVWRGLVSYTAGLTLPQGEVIAVGLGVVLGVIGVGAAWRRGGQWGATLLGVGVVSPLVVGWLANPIMPFFHERFVLVGAGLLLVATAGGVAVLGRWPLLGGVALLAVVSLNGAALSQWYHNPAYVKSDYGQTLTDILAQRQPGDLLLLNNAEQQALFDFYTPDRQTLAFKTLSNDEVFTQRSADRALERATEGYRRVWLINYGDLAVYDPQRHAEQWLGAHGFRAYFQSHRGFEVTMYLLASAAPPTAPTLPVTVTFGDGIQLVGLDLQPQPAFPGGVALATLFWQANRPPTGRYTVLCQLINEAGGLVSQFDGEPSGGTAPTTGWRPGIPIVDRRAIQLPADLPPGVYRLRVGLYTWPDLTRLEVLDATAPIVDRAVDVTVVQVK